MCSIAATTALFSTAFFMAKRFDAQASERELAWRARAHTAHVPRFSCHECDVPYGNVM